MELYHEQNQRPIQISVMLKDELQKSYRMIDLNTIQRVKDFQVYVDDKTYKLFTYQPSDYFQHIWTRYVQKNPQFQQIIIPKMGNRYHNVYLDITQDKLQVTPKIQLLPFDFQGETKNNKLNFLKDQSEAIKKKLEEINIHLNGINQNLQQPVEETTLQKMMHQEDQQRKKQFEQFRRKTKEQKEERQRKLKQQKKKQEQQLAKKEQQIQEQMEKIQKERKQEMVKKQKQLHQKRQKQKQLRAQRNTQYIRLKKQAGEKPPLFKRLEKDYNKRYLEVEAEQRQRFLNERRSLFQHIDDMKLQQHQKFYQKIREQRQQKRRQKLEQLQQQEKSRVIYNSSYELSKQPDLKQQEKIQAKEKLQKMKQYRQIVKEKFKPKIDDQKKKQLMNLIEEMDLGRRKIKKTKLENGSIIYQEIKQADARMIGIQYLQKVKEMAGKMKINGRRKSAVDVINSSGQQKKVINYLEQLRNKPRKRTSKAGFLQQINMSYDEKVKKVQLQTQKLNQLTRQKQMKLKFGKFKTSQQILACKQQIDQHYLEIVKMKLQLINQDSTK